MRPFGWLMVVGETHVHDPFAWRWKQSRKSSMSGERKWRADSRPRDHHACLTTSQQNTAAVGKTPTHILRVFERIHKRSCGSAENLGRMKDTRGLPPSEAQLSEPSKAPRSLCIVVADDDRD